jgi:hypothetical protein
VNICLSSWIAMDGNELIPEVKLAQVTEVSDV